MAILGLRPCSISSSIPSCDSATIVSLSTKSRRMILLSSGRSEGLLADGFPIPEKTGSGFHSSSSLLISCRGCGLGRSPRWCKRVCLTCVNFALATSHSHVQSGFLQDDGCLDVLPSRPGDELRSLCEDGQIERALSLLFVMDKQGTVPSVSMYRSLLRACTKRKALAEAKRVQSHIARHGLHTSRFLGESIVITLVKCGGDEDAMQAFQRLPSRTVFSWTAVISGCTRAGESHEALRLYQRMQEEGVEPNGYTFVSLLQACGSIANLEEGKRIHADVLKYRCETDLYVRTCLVDMYGKCGSIVDAQQAFDGLSLRDVVAWTAMVAACVQHGQAGKALELFKKMRQEGVVPNHRTFVSVLQACGMLADGEDSDNGRTVKIKSLELGRKIHAEALRAGYAADVYVGNTLVSMYGKCGSIVDAQKVFDGLVQHDVVTWTAMLAAYVEQGQAQRALQLYDQMQEEGVSPDARTFVTLLQACGMCAELEEDIIVEGCSSKGSALEKGRQIHRDARRKGYDADVFVGSTLVSMYGKCGSLSDAEDVFHELSHQNVVLFNAMLVAFVQQDQAAKAVQLYEYMCEVGMTPNDRSLVSVIQACGMLADKEQNDDGDVQAINVKYLQMGRAIHAEAWKKGFDAGVFVGNTLVSMYGKCGSIVDAWNLFTGLLDREVVLWNAMLGAYAQQGQPEKALHLYGHMQEEGVSPNNRTIVSTLQACGVLLDSEHDADVKGQLTKLSILGKIRAIHANAWMTGYESDKFVGITLISVYGKCGSTVDAQNVFEGLLQKDVLVWTAMLAVHAQQGNAERALELYSQMCVEGITLNDRTFASLIQACGSLAEKEEIVDGQTSQVQYLHRGKVIHAHAQWMGYSTDNGVGNSLVSMYGKCGSTVDAHNVFDALVQRNVVSWNVMLAAYVQESQAEMALQLFEQMQEENISPDAWTYVTVLRAYGILADNEEAAIVDEKLTKIRSLEMVKAIHSDTQKKGYDLDIFVGNTLINVYGKCGNLVEAQNVFSGLSCRNVVSWNVMLGAYVEHGQMDKALQLHEDMQKEGVTLNEITAVYILQLCSSIGSLVFLRQTHHILLSDSKESSLFLANTLISAYGRCSSMVDAQDVFDALRQRDVVSWTTLIAGYAREGNCAATLQMFEKMRQASVKPDAVTYLSVLSACSHAGLVDEGAGFFDSMTRDHGITPEIEHYVTMVDLFGRAGCFSRVEVVLSTMPMQPNLDIWLCLLASCRKHGKIALGEWAFECALRLQPRDAAAYSLMTNIYADAGLWDLAERVKQLRQMEGAWKQAGQTWIEHEQKVQTFIVGACRGSRHGLHDLIGKVSLKLKEEGQILESRNV